MPVLVGGYNEDYLLLNSFGAYSIGDISGSLNGTKLNIDDTSTQADISSGLGSMLSVSQSTGLYQIGDISGAGNGTKMGIDDVNTAIQFTGNVGIGVAPTVLFQVQSGGNDFLRIDPTAGTEVALLQAINSTGNGNWGTTYFEATNTTSLARFEASFNDGVKFSQIEANAFSGSSSLAYSADTHTFNIGAGVSEAFKVTDGVTNFIYIDPTVDGEFTILRALNQTDNNHESRIELQTTNVAVEFNVAARFNDGVTEARIDAFADVTTATLAYSADIHTFTGDSFLHRSGTAMTDGAAAAVGTLTNAPAAGNPTKWVAIDDNGTTRYIPAW